MKIARKAIVTLLILIIIYWLPFGVILFSSQSHIISSIAELPDSDSVIIFGTLVNEFGEITPLLRERLEAGKRIFEEEKSKTIVVSNTHEASSVMARYLHEQGIPESLIEIDTQANKTPDTCAYEKQKHFESRKIIFVSQKFHLPRLLYQCSKLNVRGVAFPVENLNTTDRSEYSLLTKIFVRTSRYTREAGLTWLAFLGIY